MTQKIVKEFGPPGSGKTHTLLNVLERELNRGLSAENIAYITFTRAARTEAKERARVKFDFDEEELRHFSTLHSICYRMIGINKQMVISSHYQLREFGEKFGYDFSFRSNNFLEEDNLFAITGNKNGDKYLGFHHWMRHKLLDFETAYKRWPDTLEYWDLKRFCEVYERYKKDEGLVDFTDFLMRAKFPLDIDIAFVDEAQDLSDLQWRTLWKVVAKAKKVYIAGDDDQAIFTWAGASPEAFLAIKGKTRVLDQSFRLSQAVYEQAHKIVSKIGVRQPKAYMPTKQQGEVMYRRSFADVDIEPPASYDPERDRMPWRVLVRNNYFKDDILAHLRSMNIPCSDTGASLFDTYISEAILGWADLQKGKRIPIDTAIQIYEHVRTGGNLARGGRAALRKAKDTGVGRVRISDLVGNYMLSKEASKMPWHDALDALDDDNRMFLRSAVAKNGLSVLTSKPWLDVSTIHGAKGAEATNVVLVMDMAARCHETLSKDPDSELRVWYTGATRAADRLVLVGENDRILS